MDLEQQLAQASGKKTPHLPSFFDLSKEKDITAVKKLLSEKDVSSVIDDYEEEEKELFGIMNPSKVYTDGFEREFQAYREKLNRASPAWQRGVWVYYPWRNTLSHILPEKDFYTVRTARNRNLITAEEQQKFYNATVGIAGLSVGSSIALALTLQGGPKKMKLADMGNLALSNTNRVLAGVESLGIPKVEVAARRIYEINPYSKIKLFPEGLTQKNISSFFEGLDIVVDELDNIAVKYLLREEAKKKKIPVVMGADNGDNAVIDIERYDIESDLEFFHGRLGKVTYEELSKLDKFGIGKTITKHIGPENVTVRMQESLLEMGKTIVSWPQLGGAAMINGAAIAYSVRKILNGQPLEKNRAIISLDEKLMPGYNSSLAKKKRRKAARLLARR